MASNDWLKMTMQKAGAMNKHNGKEERAMLNHSNVDKESFLAQKLFHLTTNTSNEAEAEKLVDCLLRCLGVIRQGLCFSLSLNREAYYYSVSVSLDDYFLNDEVLIFSSELENVQKMTKKQQTDLLEQARERGRTELNQIQLNQYTAYFL